MENNESYSCVDCIWHDQCESSVPCEFFDAGCDESLVDDKIEKIIESDRKEYGKAYTEYVSEFSDGNITYPDMSEFEFDKEEME